MGRYEGEGGAAGAGAGGGDDCKVPAPITGEVGGGVCMTKSPRASSSPGSIQWSAGKSSLEARTEGLGWASRGSSSASGAGAGAGRVGPSSDSGVSARTKNQHIYQRKTCHSRCRTRELVLVGRREGAGRGREGERALVALAFFILGGGRTLN